MYLLYIDYMAFLIPGEKLLRVVFPQLLVIILVHSVISDVSDFKR